MNLDIDMTREQLIEALSALFEIDNDRLYNRKHSAMAYTILENLSYKLHVSISPKKDEWIKTTYFNDYFTEHSKEMFLANH